jgi:Vam6/Vps39-like protein vacuolar protein sorting-associated protein 39
MDLFSNVSANPQNIVSLFPPVIAGEWSEHEESEESNASTTEQVENGTPSVARTTPDGARTSLDSLRRSKDGESETSSILSKHTEISTSRPTGKDPVEPPLFLEGKDLIRATLALVRYLADMRFKLSHWLNADEPDATHDTNGDQRILFSPSLDAQDSQGNITDTELEEAAELVDTTLFRAYMSCRPQLVGPLVRRPNRCIPSVVQEMLEQAHVLLDNVYV